MVDNILKKNVLGKKNITKIIKAYEILIEEMEKPISELIEKKKSINIKELLKSIKRDPINVGPYKNVSLFEAANRIMTDLVILYGINDLLSNKYEKIEFSKYTVQYGNSNTNSFDIIAKNYDSILIGEAFNVSPSYFKTKRNKSINKLNKGDKITINGKEIIVKERKIIKILIYNSDAIDPKDNKPITVEILP